MPHVFKIGDKILVLGSGVSTTGQLTAVTNNVPPSFSVAPVVSGTKMVGQQLSTTNGTFSGTPTPNVTAYEWHYSVSGSGTQDGVINSQTTATYIVDSAYTNYYIRSKVTVTNAAGTSTSTSAWYGPIDAALTAWPDATNTGPRFAMSNSGNVNSSSNGQIIERLRITGRIIITHSNVTVRDCEIISDGFGLDYNGGSNLRVEYCRFKALNANGGNKGSYGLGMWSGSAVVERCDISRLENGAFFAGTGKQFLYNYVHDMQSNDLTDPHYDGFQCTGAGGVSNILFQGNNVILKDTSCIIMQNEDGGYSGTITVTGNRLIGVPSVAAPIYARGDKTSALWAANLVVTNNVIDGNAYGYNLDNTRGPGSGWPGSGTLTWTGNKKLNGTTADP